MRVLALERADDAPGARPAALAASTTASAGICVSTRCSSACSRRPDQKLDPEMRALAIVGLCQLLYTDIPAHAAVAETVDAARQLRPAARGGIVNAVLRRCQREHAQLAARDRSRHRACAPRIRAGSWTHSQCDWGDAVDGDSRREQSAAAVLGARESARASAAREYRDAACRPAAIAAAPACSATRRCCWRTPWTSRDCRDSRRGWSRCRTPPRSSARDCSHRSAGERVLDACAAPGGKTGHLLELQPELAAADRGRCFSRAPDAECREPAPAGDCQATLVAATPAQPADWWDGRPFDRILLDVPCSATGVIRRHPDIKLLRRRGRHRGARRRAVAAAAQRVAVARAGRATGLCELLGAAGRNHGGGRWHFCATGVDRRANHWPKCCRHWSDRQGQRRQRG